MAQLVKLQNYISRYQMDLVRYPTQFVRLKKIQWDRVKQQWKSNEDGEFWGKTDDFEEVEKKSPFALIKKFIPNFRKNKQAEQYLELGEVPSSINEEYDVTEETTLLFEPNFVYTPETLEDLKRMFLEQFFQFQIKWASSTLLEKSYVDSRFFRDTLLRTLLQKLPDTYLIFYYPILKLKNAPVEMEVIVITPTDCVCITVLEQEDQAVYVDTGDRFWLKKIGRQEKKILNPFINLNRMENILTQLFKQEGVTMAIRKVLLSRNGYFDHPNSANGIKYVDKRKYLEWLEEFKRSSSPMKHMQFRGAQTILNTVETVAFNRNPWQTSEEDITE